jgi:predicted nucleic-acid-binding Zn-ribbon protein
MVHGDVCPKCGSKNVTDNEIAYTCESISRTSADWYCPDCGCTYAVLYKFDEIQVDEDEEDI